MRGAWNEAGENKTKRTDWAGLIFKSVSMREIRIYWAAVIPKDIWKCTHVLCVLDVHTGHEATGVVNLHPSLLSFTAAAAVVQPQKE